MHRYWWHRISANVLLLSMTLFRSKIGQYVRMRSHWRRKEALVLLRKRGKTAAQFALQNGDSNPGLVG